MALIYIALVALVLVGGLLGYRWWEHQEAYRRLIRWAQGNEYQLEDARICPTTDRPPFLAASFLQVVFRVRLRAPGIGMRDGWVRMGGYFNGLYSPVVDVFWDSPV